MQSTSVGIRDAKVHLSKLLKMAQRGFEIILTDRGRPVGKIVPIRTESLPLSARIKHLEEEGIVAPLSNKGRGKIPPPIPISDSVAQRFLKEDRENGKS